MDGERVTDELLAVVEDTLAAHHGTAALIDRGLDEYIRELKKAKDDILAEVAPSHILLAQIASKHAGDGPKYVQERKRVLHPFSVKKIVSSYFYFIFFNYYFYLGSLL
mgnify:CR=1 FL=1